MYIWFVILFLKRTINSVIYLWRIRPRCNWSRIWCMQFVHVLLITPKRVYSCLDCTKQTWDIKLNSARTCDALCLTIVRLIFTYNIISSLLFYTRWSIFCRRSTSTPFICCSATVRVHAAKCILKLRLIAKLLKPVTPGKPVPQQ